jgi:hypothetical protein
MSVRFVPVARAITLLFAVHGLLPTAPVAAQDADRDRARTEFQRGVDAFGRAEYQTALDAFQEAYRLAPHPAVRVNIANCYERLDRPLEALFHFEHFLSEAERPSPQQRREVETSIARLEQRVGRLQLQITPDGALVTIDGTEQRRAPVVEPVRVVAGRHSVVIELDGYQREEQQIEVRGGQTARVAIRLRRTEAVASSGAPVGVGAGASSSDASPGGTSGASSGASAAGASSAASPGAAGSTGSSAAVTTGDTRATTARGDGDLGDGRDDRAFDGATAVGPDGEPGSDGGFVMDTTTWIAGSVTIAAAIGAGITGGLALSEGSEFERLATAYEASGYTDENARVAAEDAAGRARTLAMVSDVLLVTTIVGAGATIFFLVTTQDGGLLDEGASEPESARARGPSFAVAPILGPDLAGVTIAGSL